jgi:Mn-dependent DtxR family transcriptional regulator
MTNGTRPRFNHKEVAVISTMRRNRRHAFTANELSVILDISWHTADRILKRLFKRGYVMKGRRHGGRTIYWRLVE